MTDGPAPSLPQLCGDIDIRIAADGTWFHDGGPIGRKELVRLFAGVLMRDDAGDYWLKTPAEQARIQVEDVPFIGVELTVTGRGRDQALTLRTNVDDTVTLDADHPLHIVTNRGTGAPRPYVTVRDGLDARLTRSVYYELVDLGTGEAIDGEPLFGVWSGGCFFPLGKTEDTPC